ncbi:MAG: GAF domain-containing protein [Planctomycetia bacterium]|nr:GAF domain-containing protein [Planctomycetia bacterium]
MTSPAPPHEPDWHALVSQLIDTVDQARVRSLEAQNQLLALARSTLRAAEAGLLVPADDPRNLRFLASLNSTPQITQKVLSLLVPCDRSIGGYVFSTGLPLAYVNDPQAADEPQRLYKGVDEATGLVTRVYLAVPVQQQERILGVLTFVNRPGGDEEPFTAQEMQWGQRFAALAAALLQFHERVQMYRVWAEGELRRAAQTGTAPLGPLAMDIQEEPSQMPLARIVGKVEALPPHDQELVADLLEVLAVHWSRRADHD